MGRHAAFDSVMTMMASRNASFHDGAIRFEELWNRRDYDGAEKLARAQADTAKPLAALGAQDALVGIAVLRGRLHEAERRFCASERSADSACAATRTNPYLAAQFHAMVDGQLRGDVPRALAGLDAVAPRESASLRSCLARPEPVGRVRLLAPRCHGEGARSDEPARSATRHAGATAGRGVPRAYSRYDRARGGEGRQRDRLFSSRRHGGRWIADRQSATVCTPLFIGLAFDRGGQADSARAYLRQYVEMSGTAHSGVDRYYLAPALFRLGELYESAGDVKNRDRVLRPVRGSVGERRSGAAAARRGGAKRIERLNRASR